MDITTTLSMCLYTTRASSSRPSYTRPGEFILKSQPQPSATTAATPSVACWPPSPPTPWSGTPGSWSQVEQVQNLKHRKSQKGNRMPRSVRLAVLIATKTISTLQTLTGQEGTVQDQHLLPSQLMIYQASFGFDLEQNLAVTLLGNDQEANKTRSNSRMGIDMVS